MNEATAVVQRMKTSGDRLFSTDPSRISGIFRPQAVLCHCFVTVVGYSLMTSTDLPPTGKCAYPRGPFVTERERQHKNKAYKPPTCIVVSPPEERWRSSIRSETVSKKSRDVICYSSHNLHNK